MSHNSQRKFTFNLWPGIVKSSFLGPRILPEKLAGCVYLAFLQEVLQDVLDYVPILFVDAFDFRRRFLAFQPASQNTSAGYFYWVLDLRWPPRSPDLSPIYYFLWVFF